MDNQQSLLFLRQCFTAHQLTADEIAKSMVFFINTMQRVESIPEERVLAAIFFISIAEKIELLFEITAVSGVEDLRKKINDFDLLREFIKRYQYKSTETITRILNPAIGPIALCSSVENEMLKTKYSTKLGEVDKGIWNTALRDFIRKQLPSSKTV